MAHGTACMKTPQVSCVYLVGQLVETAIFASHEDPAVVCPCDVQDVGVVSGDSKQWLRKQMHLPKGRPWRRTKRIKKQVL